MVGRRRYSVEPAHSAPTRDMIANEAMRYIGYPSAKYRRPDSGTGTDGFDCSGFVSFVLKNLGVKMPPRTRHASEMFDRLGVSIHEELRQRGDLVFFSRKKSWTNAGMVPTHVGIMISKDEYIHSPGTDGGRVRIDRLEVEPIAPTGSEQLYSHNPIGFKRISYGSGRYQRILRRE